MKPPPLLLGVALLFWGWQTGFFVVAGLMAVVLEGAHLFKSRWEFTDEDFTRIWMFCSLLLVAATIYAFTSTEAPSDLLSFLQNPNFVNQRNAGNASARAVAALIRWQPMIFFPFIAAQTFSSREGIPLQTISLILRARWKKARKLGQSPPPAAVVKIGYVYFALCLFASSIHASEGHEFFWGVSLLLTWALWGQRSPRFSPAVWAATLLMAIGLGYFGQQGVSQLQHYLGNLNPQWFSSYSRHRFDARHTRTTIGNIGRSKTSSTIVIRLEPKESSKAPPLLREASYRSFSTPRTWSSGPSTNAEPIYPETNSNSFVLLPGKTNTALVSIGCYLPGGQGLLPLPEGSARLDNLSAFGLAKNNLGAVMAEGPGLVVFDASYGPGLTIDSLPDADDLVIDPSDKAEKEIPTLKQVIDELNLQPGQPLPQVLRTINEFFQREFTYATWQPPIRGRRNEETALTRFLLRTRRGHCEYFATATVLLLRQLGYPARYAVGYAVHEPSGKNQYVVRQRDAHAWCLVWHERSNTWRDFDTTPASWIEAEAKRASALQFFSDLWSRIGFEISKIRWGQSRLRQYLLWSLLPVLLLLLYQIIFRSRRKRRESRKQKSGSLALWPGKDSEFYLLERKLVELGLERYPGEPLSDWLLRAATDPTLDEIRVPLHDILHLHYRYRFDPCGLDESDREALRQQTKTCLEILNRPQQAVTL